MQVAICSPMFNVAKYVQAMIDSCKAQTHKDWTLQLYDDGSDDVDRHPTVLGLYGEEHNSLENARVWMGPHVGLVRAMNRSLQMAFDSPAEVIARLDADDTMDPTRLEKQVALIEAGADIVTCEMNRMDEDGGNLRPKPVGPMDPEAYLSGRSPHAPIDATLVCRAEVYRQVGLWNPAYPWAAVDEWIIRALDFGFKWAHVPEFLYNYRTRPGQVVKESKGRSEATYQWLAERARTWQQHPASQS
jgi:glycosyltransferase involved in cell wall biosynthesis